MHVTYPIFIEYTLRVNVKVPTLDIVPLVEKLTSEALRLWHTLSRDLTVLSAHPCVYLRMKWTIGLPAFACPAGTGDQYTTNWLLVLCQSSLFDDFYLDLARIHSCLSRATASASYQVSPNLCRGLSWLFLQKSDDGVLPWISEPSSTVLTKLQSQPRSPPPFAPT